MTAFEKSYAECLKMIEEAREKGIIAQPPVKTKKNRPKKKDPRSRKNDPLSMTWNSKKAFSLGLLIL